MYYALFIIFTAVILFFALYQWQYFMVFTPVYVKERQLPQECEYVAIKTDDGVTLEGVVYEPKNAKTTLLFFGGRSHDSVALVGKLSACFADIRIVAFNYRSYGESGGVANEKNLLSDGVKIAQTVQKHYGDFFILGFSLGSSIAAYAAAHQNTQGLFLVGSFDSIDALVAKKYGKLAAKFSRYHFNTQGYLQDVSTPVYLFASVDDETTYIQNIENLAKSVKNLALFIKKEQLSHKELLWDAEVCNTINKVMMS